MVPFGDSSWSMSISLQQSLSIEKLRVTHRAMDNFGVQGTQIGLVTRNRVVALLWKLVHCRSIYVAGEQHLLLWVQLDVLCVVTLH